MKNITINLPEMYIRQCEYLVEKGIYHNRSQIIRNALRDFLNKDLELLKELIEINGKIEKKRKEPPKLSTIFIPKAKRKEVRNALIELGINF